MVVRYGWEHPRDRAERGAAAYCSGCGESTGLHPEGNEFVCRWCVVGTVDPGYAKMMALLRGAPSRAELPEWHLVEEVHTTLI